jgi:type IV pilus assembly protein PilY1
MWAVDISDASPLLWESKYKDVASAPLPLFKAQHGLSPVVDQPITMKPVVVFHPTQSTNVGNAPNVMLFFGTGQYLAEVDNGNTETQTFYGVWDRDVGNLNRSVLQGQTLMNDSNVDADGNKLRLLSNNAVDYTPLIPSNQQYGWYFDLPATGERSVLSAYVRGDIVYYNTWIPGSSVTASACSPEGSGYLMSVSQATGGEPSEPAFNKNSDTVVDASDRVSFAGVDHAPAGKKFSHGMPTASGFVGDYRYTGGTQFAIGGGGGGDCPIGECDQLPELDLMKTGRLSWQELGRD